MSQTNQISAAISAADKASITSDISDLKTKLASVLIFNLEPGDRQTMAKMGDKTLAFVQKSLEYAGNNAAMVPAFLDVTEANKDYALAHDLYDIHQQLATLIRGVEDTMMIAGSEAFDAALIFYNAVKGANRSNVAGSQAINDDLKQRFPRKSKQEASQPPPSKQGV